MQNDHLDVLGRLRGLTDDPPPTTLLAAARAAFSWRTVDTDLCRPAYDSLLDEALTATRGGHDARLLRFAFDDLVVDVEISSEADSRTVVGQRTPAMTAELTVRHGGAAEQSVRADELGRFVAEGLRPGPLSIRCVRPSGGGAVHTDWVLV
jgi:hypothetical protein